MTTLPFQSKVDKWVLECFGAEIRNDKRERAFRFLEEALELVQATRTLTKEDCQSVVNYVYNRPPGDQLLEVGGTSITFAALCNALDISIEFAGHDELHRCWANIDKIRDKALAKELAGPSVKQKQAEHE
jgi:hypothetical protein